MSKRAVMKRTQVMISFQIESETESEIVQAINTIVAACLFLWQLYQLTRKPVTRFLITADEVIKAITFGYQIAQIRARSLAWGVLNL